MYKKGSLILSSRNRLYNAASLNNFTLKEFETKNYKELIQEIIDLREMSFDQFKKVRKEKLRK